MASLFSDVRAGDQITFQIKRQVEESKYIELEMKKPL